MIAPIPFERAADITVAELFSSPGVYGAIRLGGAPMAQLKAFLEREETTVILLGLAILITALSQTVF